MKNTFVISFFTLVCGFPIPILLAIVINSLRQNKLKRVVQTAVYMPYFISTVVMVAILQILLSPTTGVISGLLKDLHLIPRSVNLLGTPGAFVPVYVLSGVWQSAGWNSIIFIAALAAVDRQLYDAARVDGASKIQQVIHVSIPCILPTVIVTFIMQIGTLMSVGYEKIILLYNPVTLDVADVISSYTYRTGLVEGNYSFGSAVGLFNSAINLLLVIFANKLSRKISEVSLW